MVSEFGVDGVGEGRRKPQAVRPNGGTEKEWNVTPESLNLEV